MRLGEKAYKQSIFWRDALCLIAIVPHERRRRLVPLVAISCLYLPHSRIFAYAHILIYPSTISRSVDGYLIEDGVAVAVIGFENGFVLEGAV